MAYQVLARKYRPQRFSDVAGQEHVTRTLLNALAQGRTAHGYIFSGHRGIGKTSVARILAMALNCQMAIGSKERPDPEPCGRCISCQEIRAGNAVDMLEIDAATNRGIDEIRELRDAARYSPSRDRYKIYLLDEAHQITDAAFNALLKTLEEPPEHIVFMMATTQPEDIPQTIRSRCQHFSFHAVKFEDILSQLRQITELEGITAEESALALLAEAGDGSMRDALSIMDQAIASASFEGEKAALRAEQIRELIGNVPNTVFERLLEEVHRGESAAVMEEANRLIVTGNSPPQIARQLVRYLRNCLMAKLGGENSELLQISADERSRAARSAELFSEEDLTRFLQTMLRTFDDLNYRQEQRFHLELGLVKLVHLERLIPLEQVLSGLPGAALPPQPPGSKKPGSLPGSRSVTRQAQPAPSAPQAAAAVSSSASPSTASLATEKQPIQAVSYSFGTSAAEPAATLRNASESFSATAEALASDAEPETPQQEISGQQEPATIERIRNAVVAALDGKGHQTAASLLSAGRWSWNEEGGICAEVGVKKAMLSLAMNAAAWQIARDALRELGITQKMSVEPVENAGLSTASLPPAPSGSIQAVALENPLVQRAQELFRAEVRNILDLRETSRNQQS